ncbi:hypothetical protein, conserved [Trypanosoma brucei gambiense DAL972]|uniref:PSI domain-containing protein n=1 Tax=Trypanosoma brucei gambiense (strain MHOM/CI/86/DAL972) TaxID=679716 RepID=D0A4M2_TRYB9|nr:hypothetical protein, conserved [Trypanosoma brucei gambiense DAL972]CBH16216.1 hypothetical protein, conserved [Trypanosoma brucei gambiense DAL972]|eukprot:XP_011778480.1 hypothetical protein, conserved [Trypanosoma brucei gambiense DAL972]
MSLWLTLFSVPFLLVRVASGDHKRSILKDDVWLEMPTPSRTEGSNVVWPVVRGLVALNGSAGVGQVVNRLSSNESLSVGGLVGCGDGYCPSFAPICCGGPAYYYCVSGGSKCCGFPGRVVGSCGQSEECCADERNVTCCEAGSYCKVDGSDLACASDTCSHRLTVDECLSQNDGCGWCCEEHRCVRNTSGCSKGGRPIAVGETCPSRCHYADTCGLCLASGDAASGLEDCMWCCGSQSCIPSSEGDSCQNLQGIVSPGFCSACLSNGEGVGPTFVGSLQQMLALFSSFVFMIGIISCVWVSRACATYRDNTIVANGMRQVEVAAHYAVRRHGFIADGLSAEGGSSGCCPLLRCICCFCTTRRSDPSKQIQEEGGDGPCLSGEFYCAGCELALRPRSLLSFVDAVQGSRPPGERGICDDSDYHAEDEGIIVLLPCGHFYCYACLNIKKKRTISPRRLPKQTCSAAASDSQVRAEEALQSVSSADGEHAGNPSGAHVDADNREAGAAEAQESSCCGCLLCPFGKNSKERVAGEPKGVVDIGKLAMKKIKRKCPKCRRTVTDVLLPHNIIHL